MKKSPLVVIFVTVFVDLVGFGIIIPLSPFLGTRFGADALEIGLLMAIYSLMQFLFSPVWGQLSDNWGRRPIILISLFGAAISHAMFAFSDTLTMLFIARGLAGLFGANISTAMAYIADVTDEKNRSKGMGIVGAAFGLGFVLGPFIGGMVGGLGKQLGAEPPLGESLAALAASAICLLNFIFALKVLKESHSPQSSRQRKPRLKLLRKYLSQPTVGRLMIVFFLSTFAMAHMEAALFLYVQDVFSWDLVKASLGFAYVGVVMVFTQGYLIRKIMPKYGERRLMLAGLCLSGLGLTGIGFSNSVFMLAFVVTLLGVGVGIANPSITGSISLLTNREEQGGTLGVNQSLSALARIIGPAIGGWVYRDVSITSPFLIAGGLSFLGLVLGSLVYDRIPQSGLVKNES